MSLKINPNAARSLAIEVAWREEVRRRITEMESGQVQGIPLENTLAKARAIADSAHES
jgi:hypothetical protein